MSGSGATPVQRVSVGAGTVGLSFVDVSSQPVAAEVFSDDFSTGSGSIKFAIQEEEQLVAAALPAGDHLEDIIAASFSESKTASSDAWQVCGVDDTMEDKLSSALNEQLDNYLSQFNHQQQQPGFVSLDEELENFDNLFPVLGFD